MNEQLTAIAFILDRSGSMASVKTDAIGGFNTFVEQQRELPGDARMSLVLFDHEYTPVYDDKPIREVPELTAQTYVPRGRTALYDAVGQTIDMVGSRLARTPEPERPAKVIVAIMTDGLENASTDYSHARIAEMIKHQQDVYSWEFVFLGANMDVPAVARSLNIAEANAVAYAASPAGTQGAYRSLNERVSRMRQKPSGDNQA